MPARILLAQLHAVHSSTENLEKITEVIRKAGQNGAQMVVFPEYMMSYPAEKAGGQNVSRCLGRLLKACGYSRANMVCGWSAA